MSHNTYRAPNQTRDTIIKMAKTRAKKGAGGNGSVQRIDKLLQSNAKQRGSVPNLTKKQAKGMAKDELMRKTLEVSGNYDPSPVEIQAAENFILLQEEYARAKKSTQERILPELKAASNKIRDLIARRMGTSEKDTKKNPCGVDDMEIESKTLGKLL